MAVCRLSLTGKATCTEPSAELVTKLAAIFADMETYPHAILTAMGPDRKQTTRMLKVACRECGYTCRVTQKWLDHGAPLCQCNREAMGEE